MIEYFTDVLIALLLYSLTDFKIAAILYFALISFEFGKELVEAYKTMKNGNNEEDSIQD